MTSLMWAMYLCSEMIGTAFKSVISNIKAAQTKNQNRYCHIVDGQSMLLFKSVADDVPRLGDIAKLVQYDKLIANNDMQVSTAQEPQRVRQHPFATCCM